MWRAHRISLFIGGAALVVAAAGTFIFTRRDAALRPGAASGAGDGVVVRFDLAPAAGVRRGDPEAGRPLEARFTVTDRRTGEPVTGLRPLGWMARRAPDAAAPDDGECRSGVKAFLGGSVARQADVDMNASLVLALNDDASISVINPQISMARTKLLALLSLPGTGAEWALHPGRERLFVTVPGADRVAVVDLVTLRVKGSVVVGARPTRVAVSPDGGAVLVGNDGDRSVSVLDAADGRVLGNVEVGPGHKEIAFADGGRVAWVVASGAAEASIVDVDRREVVGRVDVGKGASSMVASESARSAVVANQGTGDLVVVSTDRRAVVRRVALRPGLGPVAIEPRGRFAFAANPERDEVAILDLSSGDPPRILDGFAKPDFFAFTDAYAYVRNARSTRISLVRLDALGKAATPPVAQVDVLQRSPADSGLEPGGAPIAANPDGASVTVAGADERALFHYREGMMAPMGAHRNYGRRARSVLLLARSLQETAPGVYTQTVRVREPGTYDAYFLADRPRAASCAAVEVGGSPSGERRRDTVVDVVPAFDPRARLATGRSTTLAFRAVDRATGAAIDGQDVSVLLFRVPGTWQWRGAARPLGGGRYDVTVTPPSPGQYKLLVALESHGAPLGAIAPVTLGVDGRAPAAEARP